MIASHARSLALELAPSGLWVRVALVVLGSALIALAAQIAIPLPGSPVPVTGQTFAVLLVAAALGPRRIGRRPPMASVRRRRSGTCARSYARCGGDMRRLGDHLVEAGVLTRPQVESALVRQRLLAAQCHKKRFGQILLDIGLVTADQLERALRHQAADRQGSERL